MPYERRTGAAGAYEDGKYFSVNGSKLTKGQDAPDARVTLYYPKGVGTNTKSAETRISRLTKANPILLLHVVNSFDTEVCGGQAETLEDTFKKEGIDTPIFHTSADTSFAQKEFADYSIKHPFLSTFGRREFGLRYGVEIPGPGWWGLLQRSAFVVTEGKIAYAQYAFNQGEPLEEKPIVRAIKTAQRKLKKA